MKIKTILLSLAFAAASNAATVTVSAGFGAQGLIVSTGGLTTVPFTVAVGNFSSGVFTQFSTSIIDTGKVNGVFTAQAPSSLNGLPLHLWVGNGAVGASTSFLILSSNAGTTFPADVAAAGGPTFNAALGTGVSLVASTGATFTPGTSTITLVPEPSAALLGAVGALGLLRRRRN